jgi:CheY-like chemotaxis protein
MTASVTEGERERCTAAGMDDFVPKPVTPAELGEALRRWAGTPA